MSVRSVQGWSNQKHIRFFTDRLAELASTCPNPVRILILGVYQGQDICIIRDIAERLHPAHQFEIVGVDKFNDEPCDDWPAEKRGMTWQQAFGCSPPCIDKAYQNIGPLLKNVDCVLYPMTDELFLTTEGEGLFDMAYLDTAHDYATVRRQLRQIKTHLRTDSSIVAGDDYTDKDGWGVKQAVSEGLKYYKVADGRIWFGTKKELV